MKLMLLAMLSILFMATSSSLVQATTYATPDCTDVSCPSLKRCNRRIRQGQPFEKVTPSGRCCPICVSTSPPPRVCNLLCIRLQCQDNEIEYKAPSECCPKCIPRGPVGPGSADVPPIVIPDAPDCSAVSCVRPDCDNIVTPDGECCPVCGGTNCDLVRCMNPDCGYGYELVVPSGECCPICQLKKNCHQVYCITTPCYPVCNDP